VNRGSKHLPHPPVWWLPMVLARGGRSVRPNQSVWSLGYLRNSISKKIRTKICFKIVKTDLFSFGQFGLDLGLDQINRSKNHSKTKKNIQHNFSVFAMDSHHNKAESCHYNDGEFITQDNWGEYLDRIQMGSRRSRRTEDRLGKGFEVQVYTSNLPSLLLSHVILPCELCAQVKQLRD